ncbi:alpha/beta-Hydrolase [Glarea lozoyensis ATCC 20868]|uniref:Alpha/beta-Hydrolase n=1 Tax=Glarea lozoyensis (strain ATCC 20868 / MF5171) TaxID=1116229 RepID=S3D802_GLAL2|nr:alpha/beta-Hydrolase [Glarea lozoyensis ATCC 20868]EPE33870.1 alpha/beta-Hydrolase [Glarea lozoyensis ATCC 20868]
MGSLGTTSKGKGKERMVEPEMIISPGSGIGSSGEAREGGEQDQEWEVKPYKIHVSSKYLTLTHKKLELTRLPHELLVPKEREREYGVPKSEIEPLIDFWTETYSWREQEAYLNIRVPQFRVALPLPASSSPPLRVHFVHLKSQHSNSVPLLVVPSFPVTNLSLTQIFEPLTNPPNPRSEQPFHIVVPSIPGLGFSDPFSVPEAEKDVMRHTAGLFDALMNRLGYEFYLVTATGSGISSAAAVDYHLPRIIAETFPERCLGAHLLDPVAEVPRVAKEPVLWAKWNVAKFFHANAFGYTGEDWKALKTYEAKARAAKSTNGADRLPSKRRREVKGYGVMSALGLREPNTLSYALCDSPVGLLSVVCSTLRKRSPSHQLSDTQIIDLTQLAWLPGVEAGARFWSTAVKEAANEVKKSASRTRVAITVFGVDGLDSRGYLCPAWTFNRHDVVFTQRIPGKPGLVPFERIDVVVAGIRGLAMEIKRFDPRIVVSPLEEAVVPKTVHEVATPDEDGHGMQLEVESPDTVVAFETTRSSRGRP